MASISSYRGALDRMHQLAAQIVKAGICARIPKPDEVTRNTGYAVLRHEMQKQRRHKPLRRLMTEAGDAVTTLAPCFMMSPMSVAQYIPPEANLFDMVIFDEASQISPWDGIGAIARGRQVIVAGDPQQMPPTNFFNRIADESDEEEVEDLESILDRFIAAGIPQISLNWHYRSRHESLITFSNHKYYGSRLVTFPSPAAGNSGVKLVRVNGIYARGKARTNQIEAKALVGDIIARLEGNMAAGRRQSIGVIALNMEQQELIEDMLENARMENPALEGFFNGEDADPLIVKNLETVQGDERDVIYISLGYGPAIGETGMSMNFGALNKDGGHRRLNVAITRSKEEMVIYSSFDPGMIDPRRTTSRAVLDLKLFMEFARDGNKALASEVLGTGDFESPFEAAVAARLEQAGWTIVPQVGVSKFRIDLGIVNPKLPGEFIAGIECDGATYHSSVCARDRDKVRHEVLTRMGWNILRVWSTDWWIDPVGQTTEVDKELKAILDGIRAQVAQT